MALDPVLNFAKVTVSTTYDAAATSIVLTAGHDRGFKKNHIPWNKGKTKNDYPQLGNSGCKNGELRGRKLSEEHKNKIAEAIKNHWLIRPKKVSEETKYKIKKSAYKMWAERDEKIRKEIGKKISLAKKGKAPFEGNKHPNWKGGISFIEYGKEFDSNLKEQIRFRDRYKCKLCEYSQLENGKQLDCHHIDYNKKNNSFDNLILLCHSCHSKTHYNREKWTKYFKEEKLGFRQCM